MPVLQDEDEQRDLLDADLDGELDLERDLLNVENADNEEPRAAIARDHKLAVDQESRQREEWLEKVLAIIKPSVVKGLACATTGMLMLLETGQVFTWTDKARVPSEVIFPSALSRQGHEDGDLRIRVVIEQIEAGEDHFAARSSSLRRNLYTWGANGSGQLGLEDTRPRASPCIVVSIEERVTDVTFYAINVPSVSGEASVHNMELMNFTVSSAAKIDVEVVKDSGLAAVEDRLERAEAGLARKIAEMTGMEKHREAIVARLKDAELELEDLNKENAQLRGQVVRIKLGRQARISELAKLQDLLPSSLGTEAKLDRSANLNAAISRDTQDLDELENQTLEGIKTRIALEESAGEQRRALDSLASEQVAKELQIHEIETRICMYKRIQLRRQERLQQNYTASSGGSNSARQMLMLMSRVSFSAMPGDEIMVGSISIALDGFGANSERSLYQDVLVTLYEDRDGSPSTLVSKEHVQLNRVSAKAAYSVRTFTFETPSTLVAHSMQGGRAFFWIALISPRPNGIVRIFGQNSIGGTLRDVQQVRGSSMSLWVTLDRETNEPPESLGIVSALSRRPSPLHPFLSAHALSVCDRCFRLIDAVIEERLQVNTMLKSKIDCTEIKKAAQEFAQSRIMMMS
ncbi:RCC1 and BTB domain-containing protein 2 [Hondaea fermentalgiana]|uniref:RCC1 and BTB domain-containing protein 2 n=1 Tax=Hondaea fermentalgiana TaxID=2315210 RepID=A0A2R5GF45_9STRA|nr:RCC1 and BTB domain-containing protein 2 [Hondaea fermentalgiana]|eukprot:GBG26861.1 RCC1 and BTB domain-containing protein 2 [Hondaea fermentalgiana]